MNNVTVAFYMVVRLLEIYTSFSKPNFRWCTVSHSAGGRVCTDFSLCSNLPDPRYAQILQVLWSATLLQSTGTYTIPYCAPFQVLDIQRLLFINKVENNRCQNTSKARFWHQVCFIINNQISLQTNKSSSRAGLDKVRAAEALLSCPRGCFSTQALYTKCKYMVCLNENLTPWVKKFFKTAPGSLDMHMSLTCSFIRESSLCTRRSLILL